MAIQRTSLAVILTSLLMISACGSEQASQAGNIRIGAVLPMSGYGATNGENSLNGYRMAIEEINAKGGIDGKLIELIIADHKGDDTKGAVSAYHSLRTQGIDIILGPNFAPLGQALAPIACEDKVLLVSPAIGIRDFAPTCDYIFNLWPVDFESSKGLGKLVVTKGYNHIAIVGSDQSWEYEQAQAVKAGIEGEKGLVSIYLIVNNKAEDFTTEATKVIHSGADVVILNNYGYMGMFAQKLRELGFKGDFYSVLIDESRKDQVKGALEGAIAVTGFTPTEEFINKYESKYGKKPDFPADTSYDAMILVADAIQESGSVQPDVLVTTLSQRKSMNGASGDLTFTVEGDTLKTPKYQVVENDKLVDYQP